MHAVHILNSRSPGSRHATQAKLSKSRKSLMAGGDGFQMQQQNATAAGEEHVPYLAFSASCMHPRITVSLCTFSLCSFADTFKNILCKRDFEQKHDASYSLESNCERTTRIYIIIRINMTVNSVNESYFFDFSE